MGEKWMKWTIGEACTKTLSKVLQKYIGLVSMGIAHIFIASLIMCGIQTIISLILSRGHIMAKPREIIGACLFGFSSFIAGILVFLTFYHGGDAGVNSLIICLSIVPGTLADKILFKHHLCNRQWIGIITSIFAGYIILGMPSLQKFLHFPLWIWLSFTTMILITLNQVITQYIKDIPPMAKNFWGGLTGLISTLIGIVILKFIYQVDFDLAKVPSQLWLLSISIGVIVVVMWSFSVISYKEGAYISLKKLVLTAFYLSTTVIVCAFLFLNENFTSAKMCGIALFAVSFCLMDKKTWNFIQTKILKRRKVNNG